MIVVTGATGNVGRTLVRLLAEAGEQVTAVSRRIGGSDVPRGVRAVPADLARPESLRPVLEDADALFLLVSGDLFASGRTPEEVISGTSGAGRIVFLSSQAVATRPRSVSHGRFGGGFERAVMDSGAEWTILRPGGFASNTFAWAESVRTRRTVAAPFGDVGLPVVDPDDIAEVAAAALRKPEHGGRIYELTGPEPVSPRQSADAIGRALGEPVAFAEQSREEARAQMLAFMPGPVVDTTLAILGEPTRDEQRVSPDIERVLGRSPGTFAAWAERNAAVFR
ncbi:NAD(P)H-binding protein [Planomonospora venezuelensis]|uniref:Uncharacterized protein YbjT (DUF2867 family) n=1 Tax=Planomonospora venezuelensis TaxID=1999 RepID=A0A841D3S1_PLAVE|nr:NAD(P)H-binding protein [Planomonospora venezuelensis]MBB5963144.1 uncharacterized protein YbjT (DUF2867 family) [Planomonospora venezuelensis]GIN00019.1 NmrA family transcriptional regulator [Planomonospora venezuelensis]